MNNNNFKNWDGMLFEDWLDKVREQMYEDSMQGATLLQDINEAGQRIAKEFGFKIVESANE